MNKIDYLDVFKKLEIDINTVESLYRYSPVFKFNLKDKYMVLKTTKEKENRANHLFEWERFLESKGINVVSPIKIRNENSLFMKDKRWVIYPFIEGRKYNQSKEDIKKAGELLGQIHALEETSILVSGFKWGEYDEDLYDDLEEECVSIKEKYKNITEEKSIETFSKIIEQCKNHRFLELREVELPMVDASWDYKANNLVYKKDGQPFIIDLDNSGRIPRIMDLALALMLFHNEIDTAEPRIFNQEEWKIFKAGYFKYVNLEYNEKKMWQEMLQFVYIDEVLWAISSLEEDESERQKEFIGSLIGIQSEKYTLE